MAPRTDSAEPFLCGGADPRQRQRNAKRFFFERVLQGDRFGNALAELGTKTSHDRKTSLTRNPHGPAIASTAASSTPPAHSMPTGSTSVIDEQGVQQLAIVPRHATGLTVIDDWSGFGQRTTGSGVIDNVQVPADAVIGFASAFSRPTQIGPLAQILRRHRPGHRPRRLCRPAGIRAHPFAPWIDSGVERAADDPLTIREVGDLTIQLHAAEALLQAPAARLDSAADPTEDSVAASIAVAEARVLTTDVCWPPAAALRTGRFAGHPGRAQPRSPLAQCPRTPCTTRCAGNTTPSATTCQRPEAAAPARSEPPGAIMARRKSASTHST
jgi:hypothetical protein